MKEMWDARYAGEHYFYGTEPNTFFREQISGIEPGDLLLPAEGEGRNAVYAARLGWRVTAVDYSAEGRNKALSLAERHLVQISYNLDDLDHYDFGHEQYDLVALIYLHLMPESRRKIHRKAVQSLRSGGRIILEAFGKNQIHNASGGPKAVEMLYSAADLQQDFPLTEIRLLEEVAAIVDAGQAHQGRADLVRMIAIKP